jgi:hypothetical protein
MTTVLGTRLTDAERVQVAAAKRLGLSLSEFARQAVLASSARVERKVAVVHPEKGTTEDLEPRGAIMLDASPGHHFVDAICTRCWCELDEPGSLCRPMA